MLSTDDGGDDVRRWGYVSRQSCLGSEGKKGDLLKTPATRGGVAPLYSPLRPSLRTVYVRHCRGPANWQADVVCRRTLIVSKGWPTVRTANISMATL